MPRLAANLDMLFTELPLLDRFSAAHEAGFTAVELLFPYAESPHDLRRQIDRLGLTMLGINTWRGEGAFGFAAVPGCESDFAATMKQALDFARVIGARQIHVLAGTVPPHQRPAAETTFIRNIATAADLTAGGGITILIEPLNPRDRPDYYLTRVEQAAGLIERIGRPNVRIQFDCYHTQIAEGDLTHRFQRHLPLIGHVQIAGIPDRGEPDQGEVNYVNLLDAIDRSGYSGFVAAEYKPSGRTADGLGWFQRYRGT